MLVDSSLALSSVLGAGVTVEVTCGRVQGVIDTNTFAQSAHLSLFMKLM